jgi:hypothetical protein
VFERLPCRVPRIMDLATGIILVTAIIAVDFYFFKFLFKEICETFEKFLKVGFYA